MLNRTLLSLLNKKLILTLETKWHIVSTGYDAVVNRMRMKM